MRITHISDCYLPRLGGIEVQISESSRRQAAAGDRVDVITATPGASVRSGSEQIDGVTVHRVTAVMPFELPVRPRSRSALEPLLRRLAPDVVHVHVGVLSPFAWGGVRAALRVRLPVLVTVHSVWGGPSRAGYRLSDSLLGWQAGVQPGAVSQVAADRVAEALPHAAPVLITPNGVDPAAWAPAARDRPPDAPVTIATAMRLAPRKRVLPLLRMFADARDEVSPAVRVRLLIAGDGPHRGMLEALVRERGLTADVEFLGRLSRPQLRQLYLASDAYVQPSVMESFGLAALEARTTGLPVIARDETGVAEFVRDGVEGLLVDDDAHMARALARIAADHDLRRRITQHNAETPPRQVWPQVLADLRDSYAIAAQRASR